MAEKHRMVKWSPPYRREEVEEPEFDLIEIERDGPIGRIVLNSPEKRNPLGYERLLQVEMAAKLLELDEEVRVVILKGQGPSFSAGYDITPVKRGERQRNMPPGWVHPPRTRPALAVLRPGARARLLDALRLAETGDRADPGALPRGRERTRGLL